MTPCEKLGYKVGDEFEVVEESSTFPLGGTIRLLVDDGTNNPKFEGVDCLVGKNSAFAGIKEDFCDISCVRPLPITLRKGDYCSTANMTESDYHAVAAAFMAAGAEEGEYPSNYERQKRPYFGTGGHGMFDGELCHAGQTGEGFWLNGRRLTPAQIIGAINAQTEPPEQEQKDVHPIDNLHNKRQARDVAEQQYQAALAEVREAYPWIRVEEK